MLELATFRCDLLKIQLQQESLVADEMKASVLLLAMHLRGVVVIVHSSGPQTQVNMK